MEISDLARGGCFKGRGKGANRGGGIASMASTAVCYCCSQMVCCADPSWADRRRLIGQRKECKREQFSPLAVLQLLGQMLSDDGAGRSLGLLALAGPLPGFLSRSTAPHLCVVRRTLPTGWVLEPNRSLQELRQREEEAWVERQAVLDSRESRGEGGWTFV